MDTEVVHHYETTLTPTLPFETLNESKKCLMLVMTFEYMRVDDPALLTNRADDAYR